jgi:glucose-1-phosphate thymidylyltransferase
MIDQGAKIRVQTVEGWYDCGQVETLLETNRHLLEHGRGLEPQGGSNVRIKGPVRVEPGVKLNDVTLGPNVSIGKGSTLSNAELRDVIVGENARLENVKLHDSLLGDEVELRNFRGKANVGDNGALEGE